MHLLAKALIVSMSLLLGSPVAAIAVDTIREVSRGEIDAYAVHVRVKPATGSVEPTIPATPTSPTIVSADGEVVVSWTAPENDGGSPITLMAANAYFAANDEIAGQCTTSETSCAISGLVGGVAYKVNVWAQNSVGWSAPSDFLEVTPISVPGTPTSPSVKAGNRQVTVSWIAPENDGGSPITMMAANVYLASNDEIAGQCTTMETSCTVTGLTGGTLYKVNVWAQNSFGWSAPSESLEVTPSGATIGVLPLFLGLTAVLLIIFGVLVARRRQSMRGGTTREHSSS